MSETGLKIHSDAAWKIASLYSNVLASETRDLAAHIDVALEAERIVLREALAAMMLRCGLATGHGDTHESLIGECEAQIQQLQTRAGQMVCGACGDVWQNDMSCGQKDNGHSFPTCYPVVRS